MVRQALLVLQLGKAPANVQDAATEVTVCRELAAEVLGRPTVEQVAAARTLHPTKPGISKYSVIYVIA